jgi:cytochrome c553
MAEHFGRAKMVHTSVMYGDLALARDAARGLASGPEPGGLPPGSEPFILELREAAASAAMAQDFAGAALAAGWMARTCGECHQAQHVELKPGVSSRPEGPRELTAHMQRYRWAVDRMWEGVIGPSEASWAAALAVLESEPPDVTELVDRGVGYAAALAQRVPELAREGRSAGDVSPRSEVFGQLLAACADCHEQARDW